MSRAMCNRVLAGSAAASLILTLLLVLVFQRSPIGLGLVPEIVGKWLLPWTATALVLGILAEAAREAIDRLGWRRAAPERDTPLPVPGRVRQA